MLPQQNREQISGHQAAVQGLQGAHPGGLLGLLAGRRRQDLPTWCHDREAEGSCLASLFMQDDKLMHVCLLKQDSLLLSFEDWTHYKRQIIEKLNFSLWVVK